MLDVLKDHDPEIFDALNAERQRQEFGLELIASENFVNQAILEATGSVLTNKYAEGMPGRRYYGGCEWVDVAENLAVDRAKSLFGAEYANVQPHSGTQANMAVFMYALNPGDTFLAMDLDAGGHLTHGSPVNFSGRLYNAISYGVDTEQERIDYDDVEQKAMQHRPKLIVVGASAYPRALDYERFAAIAKKSGALLMADIAHIAGLIAAGEHANPVPYCDFVTSTTHKTLRGPRGGLIMAKDEHRKGLDSGVCPRIQGGPLMHVIAAKAIAFRDATTPDFQMYQQQIKKNASALGASLIEQGLRLVSGGTDTHLLLVDLRPKGLTGKVAEKALDKAAITVNKNKIPFDPETPFVTSGIRLGTPALTTRGMKESEMQQVGRLIGKVLADPESSETQQNVKADVRRLCEQFPLYTHL